MQWLRLTPNSLLALPGLLLALSISVSLLCVKGKSRSLWLLIGFVLSSTGFLVGLFLEFSGSVRLEIYAVIAQYFFLLLSLALLIQFAYDPLPSHSCAYKRERLVLAALCSLAILTGMGLALFYYRFWQPHSEKLIITQLIALSILHEYCWAFLTFVRQTRRLAKAHVCSTMAGFIRPPDSSMRLVRNCMLILTLPIALSSMTILRDAGIFERDVFLLMLHLGILLFLTALILVIFSPEVIPSIGTQKQPLLLLAFILSIGTIVASFTASDYPERYKAATAHDLEQARQILAENNAGPYDPALFPTNIVYIMSLEPLVRMVISRQPELELDAIVEEHQKLAEYDLNSRILALQQLNPALDAAQARLIVRREIRPGSLIFKATDLYAGAATVQYRAYAFIEHNTTYEVGFSYAAYRDYLHNNIVRQAYAMILVTLIVLLVSGLLHAQPRV